LHRHLLSCIFFPISWISTSYRRSYPLRTGSPPRANGNGCYL
jgi:hypothetical protein